MSKITKKEFEELKTRGISIREAAVVNETYREDDNSIETIIATENPVRVIDWDNSSWERGIRVMREILVIDNDSVTFPESGQVPFLDSHNRWEDSEDAVKGSIRELKLELDSTPRKVVGRTFISSTEQKLTTKIREKHITNFSAGYTTHSEFSKRLKPGESFEYKGRSFKNEGTDKLDLMIRFKWDLDEGSSVIWGADEQSSFREEAPPVQQEQEDERIKKLMDEINGIKQTINLKTNERTNTMSDKKELTPEEIKKQERERVEGIEAIAARMGKSYKPGQEALKTKVKEAINSDWTEDQFRAHVFEHFDESKVFEKPVTDLDLSKKDAKRLSASRALQAMIDLRAGDSNAWKNNGAEAEKEAIDAASKRASDAGIKLKGMALPWDFFKNEEVRAHSKLLKGLGQRAGVDTTVAANLIPVEHWGDGFIDVLRNLGVAGPWGARQVFGVNGTLAVPKKTSTGTFHWVAQRGTGTATDFVIGQLTASPKDGWSSMVYGRRALLLSNPALDALVLDDVLQNHIVGRDKALLHGAGGNEPTGIAGTSGVGDVVGASIDHEAIVEFWTDVATNNIDVDSMKFVMNPKTAGILMKRLVVSGGYLGFLMDNMRKINGYGSIISNQANDNYLFYGDGSEAWVINWGVIDVLVNPFKDDTGDVTITAFSSMDVLVSRAGAFSVADDVN